MRLKPTSKYLVIDTSIVRSAGGENATHPTPVQCRNFLQAVYEICHCVVLTADVKDEWKRHQSRFARTWLASMFGRKKVRLVIIESEHLYTQIEQTAKTHADQKAMLKDVFLLEAALQTDKIVLSLDNTAQRLFQDAAKQIKLVRDLVWVNPIESPEVVLAWLKSGADLETFSSLGSEA